tara:strand:- start:11 stop:367 length:357 start_codon:yes stop_codon:yes gene_type:complete
MGYRMKSPLYQLGELPRGTREEMKERRAAKKQERSQKKSDRLIGKYDDQYAKKKEAIKIKKDRMIEGTVKKYQQDKITDALFKQKIGKTLDKVSKKMAKAKYIKDRRVGFKKDIGKII